MIPGADQLGPRGPLHFTGDLSDQTQVDLAAVREILERIRFGFYSNRAASRVGMCAKCRQPLDWNRVQIEFVPGFREMAAKVNLSLAAEVAREVKRPART